MLSTKNLINDYKEVPPSWIFEYYCNLDEKLTGQEIMIKSLFNPKDSAPSMGLYVDKKTKVYKFKDFSSGKGGSAINLVMELKEISFNQAALHIVNEYNTYMLANPDEKQLEFKAQAKYQVTENKPRRWNKNDQEFWTDFYIGTKFLNEYIIKPLSEYTLSKEEDGELKQVTIKGEYIYGYFKKSGELYKIYQPKNKERKYIKVATYLQGSEQVDNHNILIIQSGIKDIGAMKSLELKVDCIAPDSENVMIPELVIKNYKKKYKYIFVMFDNDEAGIKAMNKYREEYKLPCILITDGKDLAEAVKAKGPSYIRQKVISAIELKTFALS